MPRGSESAEAAARVLAQLSPRFKDQIPTFIENLRYQDQRLYRGGISSIVTTGPGRAGSISAESIGQLATALHNSKKEIREAAAYDLSAFHPRHFAALRVLLPDLTQALADIEPRVRLRAAEAIIVISSERPSGLIASLEELLTDDDFAIRLRACEALRKLGPAARNALSSLRSHTNDSARVVRIWATEAARAIDSVQDTD